MYRQCAQFSRPVTLFLSLPRADTAVRPYAEIVRVTPHDETNVEFAQWTVAVGWTHRIDVVVFDKKSAPTRNSFAIRRTMKQT